PMSIQRAHNHPYLPSFPTRRSSDLELDPNAMEPLLEMARAASEDSGRGSRGDAWEANLSLDEHREKFFKEITSQAPDRSVAESRSEEHTSELQSREKLVGRHLLEKK